MSAGACSLCGNARGECECKDNLLSLAESAYEAHVNGDGGGQLYYEKQALKYQDRFSPEKYAAILSQARSNVMGKKSPFER